MLLKFTGNRSPYLEILQTARLSEQCSSNFQEIVALIWKYYKLHAFRSNAPQIYRKSCTLTLLSESTYISGQLFEE